MVLDNRVYTILGVVHVSPIAVMQAASMAFLVSTAVTVRRILCIQTALALLRAAPSLDCTVTSL